ncbi:hypothetical protein RRG08_008559 [Elysia crispata]|uniref:Uncharacterized protein n=1 Tax=Elysia crispata TaxID=231223 RepID=A0AAE0YP49_9GAST|nr:hypothetical protein RRG08_008559 [Elysia crispata]
MNYSRANLISEAVSSVALVMIRERQHLDPSGPVDTGQPIHENKLEAQCMSTCYRRCAAMKPSPASIASLS